MTASYLAQKFTRIMTKMVTQFFISIIRIYQRLISPFIVARCRFYPTCSQYGYTALHWHGVWRGLLLISARIARCHPLGSSGIDFVPLPLYRFHYIYVAQTTVMTWYQGYGVYRDIYHYGAHLNCWLNKKY